MQDYTLSVWSKKELMSEIVNIEWIWVSQMVILFGGKDVKFLTNCKYLRGRFMPA